MFLYCYVSLSDDICNRGFFISHLLLLLIIINNIFCDIHSSWFTPCYWYRLVIIDTIGSNEDSQLFHSAISLWRWLNQLESISYLFNITILLSRVELVQTWTITYENEQASNIPYFLRRPAMIYLAEHCSFTAFLHGAKDFHTHSDK